LAWRKRFANEAGFLGAKSQLAQERFSPPSFNALLLPDI
jgi:hypothetical protein